MAREEERWCFFNGANRQRGSTRILPLLVILCTLLIGSLAHDDSYYNYASLGGKSLWDQQFWNIEFTGGTDVARIRRATLEPMVTTEQKEESSKNQPPSQPQQQSQQPQQQQPQQEQPQQQAPTVQPIHPVNTSAMTYSTTHSTSEAPTTASFGVSKPIKKVPSQIDQVDDTSKAHVWANQTWNRNVSKEQQSVDAKNNQTTVSSLTTSPMNTVTPQTIGADETNTTDDISDISISKFSDVNNNTKVMTDNHLYYNSTFFSAPDICKKYWVDMDNHSDLRINHLLSQSHRRAATIKLKFDFPFYGHKVRNITIATGGFLYTGEYVHSWLAATQYIAPLMANFDTRLSNASYVKYADNGTAFTVEWEKVVLQDKPEAGSFTFQVTLHQNGDIVFVYSDIPMKIDHIEDTAHPVKVGVSDAYIMDRTVFFVRRKTIYEYHRVTFDQTHGINNCTTIYLKALPTCLSQENCRDCVTKVPTFECKWCPELNQCSTGTSRQRQDWLLKGCDTHNIKEQKNCSAQITTYKGDEYDHDGHVHLEEALANEITAQERPGTSPLGSTTPSNMNMSVSGIIGILTIIALVVGLVGWGAYAYRNPHSTSGQMLIRYRPSQWSWRRGEARYTAATIHM